jgi:hypothetical protein
MARIPANSKESPLESEATARPPLYVRVARFAQPGTAEGIMIVRPPRKRVAGRYSDQPPGWRRDS